jgi:hypothetical protein
MVVFLQSSSVNALLVSLQSDVLYSNKQEIAEIIRKKTQTCNNMNEFIEKES